jgi:hypothetical protein
MGAAFLKNILTGKFIAGKTTKPYGKLKVLGTVT